MTRKGRRNQAIFISSSDDDKDADFSLESSYRFSESASNRKNPKRAKKVPSASSCPRPLPQYRSSGFDEIQRSCEEFDQGLIQFKVTSGSSCDIDMWVEKYKPSCLEELAVHKKKVEEVRMWFEERLRNSTDNSVSNAIILSGQAGVGKSATIYAIARHLGVEVHEWNTPTPTIWKEHLHNCNSGIQYKSKLDEFESFVERIRKYGLLSSSSTRLYSSSILLVDDLPVVHGMVSYGRLQRCLHLLVQSVRIPTAILINDTSRSEYTEHHSRYSGELQLALQNAGACKVAFNPITVHSIKRLLKKICREERFEASDEQIDGIAKASGGDIRHGITSLQYFSLKPHPRQSVSERVLAYPEKEGSWSGHLDDGASLPFGKDATLSLFHALGKFLYNKRETEYLVSSDGDAVPLKEKFVRRPLKMDAPELVISQAHGQARSIADFLHENVLDFLSEDAVEDAWIIGRYLSDADLLLAASSRPLCRDFEDENAKQSIAASVAVRGVLFGNSYPVSSRWHAIRRPVLWQVEQSLWCNKYQILNQSRDAHIGIRQGNPSFFATELKPALNWLGNKVPEHTDVYNDQNKVDFNEDECHYMSLDEKDNEICGDGDDDIEDW